MRRTRARVRSSCCGHFARRARRASVSLSLGRIAVREPPASTLIVAAASDSSCFSPLASCWAAAAAAKPFGRMLLPRFARRARRPISLSSGRPLPASRYALIAAAALALLALRSAAATAAAKPLGRMLLPPRFAPAARSTSAFFSLFTAARAACDSSSTFFCHRCRRGAAPVPLSSKLVAPGKCKEAEGVCSLSRQYLVSVRLWMPLLPHSFPRAGFARIKTAASRRRARRGEPWRL